MAYNYVVNDPLAAIYNESRWRLSNVSPMYNLLLNQLKLKQYATKVRQTLVSTVAANSKIKFTVVLNDLPHLKYVEEDPNGLMVTVSSTQDGSKTKQAYTAILLSWGFSLNIDGATHLPYMLECGEQRIGTAVKTSLQTIFDCNIKQFTFTQPELLQFLFNLMENDTSKYTDPLTLTYTIPQVDVKSKITMAFEVGDVYAIWNGLKKEVDKASDCVAQVYELLQNQIYYKLKLDVAALNLCEITLPKANVKSTGVVKLKTPEAVNSVLSVLNEICLHGRTQILSREGKS